MRRCLLLLLIAACGPPQDVPPDVLTAGIPTTSYVQHAGGRTLFFEIPFVNKTDSALTLYFFAYAADNVAQPPARAVYPPRALASMPPDRRFAVANPLVGLALSLPPADSARFRGALPLPATWTNGQPIASQAFRELRVYVYDAEGRAVYAHTWTLPEGARPE